MAGEGDDSSVLDHHRAKTAIVNRLNKTEAFRDLKVLYFDLRTATICYSSGFNASIAYSPEADSYEVSFSRDDEGKASPHDPIAPLLSDRLNNLTSAVSLRRSSMVGRQFIGVCVPQLHPERTQAYLSSAVAKHLAPLTGDRSDPCCFEQ